jgi:hypothetical protein
MGVHRGTLARSTALFLLAASNLAFGAQAARAFLLPSPLSRIIPTIRVSNKNDSKRKQVISSAESVAALTRGGSITIETARNYPKQQRQRPADAVSSSSAGSIQRGGGAKAADASNEKTGASMAASIFNLVNNVAGAGILTLAAGKASGTGWIPAVAIVAFLGWASSTTFRMIAKACELTGEKDFKVHDVTWWSNSIFCFVLIYYDGWT